MKKVFITMHDLSSEGNVVYASDSISDVLGYAPHEVVGKSCFEYFHPDEVAAARSIHRRGVELDRAAMLIYCKIRRKDGEYSFCECIFNMVYDVFVTAITIHSNNSKSEGRALTAPVIRRVFSTSPNDPRYHMLTHLSPKFQARPRGSHEPRAALILNRFTRSLSILYASHALSDILDFPPDGAIGKSFYECISEQCLQDAVEVLERAKENDSIAYLRFRWRDPRLLNRSRPRLPPRRSTTSKRKRSVQEDSEDGRTTKKPAVRKSERSRQVNHDMRTMGLAVRDESSSASTANTSSEINIPDGMDDEVDGEVDGLLTGTSDEDAVVRDVEAVVSSTSDGLVVILRLARPMIPKPLQGSGKGVFASPWAAQPVGPSATAYASNASDLAEAALMETIQQVAVFAWSLKQLGGEVVLPDGKKFNSSSSRLPRQSKENEDSLEPAPTAHHSNGEISSADSTRATSSRHDSNDPNDTPATTVSRDTSDSGNNGSRLEPQSKDDETQKHESKQKAKVNKTDEVLPKEKVTSNCKDSISRNKGKEKEREKGKEKEKEKESVVDLDSVDAQLEQEATK